LSRITRSSSSSSFPAKSDAAGEAAEVFPRHGQLVTWVYAQPKPGMLRNTTY
jgi:hypothetical protein